MLSLRSLKLSINELKLSKRSLAPDYLAPEPKPASLVEEASRIFPFRFITEFSDKLSLVRAVCECWDSWPGRTKKIRVSRNFLAL